MSVSEKTERQSKVGKVEVQEVFELTELQNHWSEICSSKQYYVWVPGAKRKAKKPESVSTRVHKYVQLFVLAYFVIFYALEYCALYNVTGNGLL